MYRNLCRPEKKMCTTDIRLNSHKTRYVIRGLAFQNHTPDTHGNRSIRGAAKGAMAPGAQILKR